MAHANWNVMVTDCDHGDIEEEKRVFKEFGVELAGLQLKKEEELIRECRDADGLLIQYAPLTRKVLEQLPRCKVISRYGVGVDSIDLKAASDLGILVSNVPDYCVEEVAIQAMTLFMALTRKTVFFDQRVRKGHWDYMEGGLIHRIRGKTIGLLGCGKIGMEVARIAAALGMKVLAYDPYIQKAEGIRFVNLDTLWEESDCISVHCPLNETTRHLLGEDAFRKMKKKPLIVNTSRGPIVDEQALISALNEGRVSGAGLDVQEKEPPDLTSPLFTMENVIFSPHMGFYSEESIRDLNRRTAENVVDVLQGRLPRSVVNRDVIGKTRAKIIHP